MKDILGLMALSWPLVLLVLIVLAMLIAVPLAIRYARKSGRNKWAWGIGVFLLIFLPVFWDWIPTVLMHKYYCSTEAGFWVYKTVDEWKAENPGVMEGLISPRISPSKQIYTGTGYIITHSLNQRIDWVLKKEGPLPVHRWRWEKSLVDSKTGEVLARYVDFASGNGAGSDSELRFWLHADHCDDWPINSSKYSSFLESFANRDGKGASE